MAYFIKNESYVIAYRSIISDCLASKRQKQLELVKKWSPLGSSALAIEQSATHEIKTYQQFYQEKVTLMQAYSQPAAQSGGHVAVFGSMSLVKI